MSETDRWENEQQVKSADVKVSDFTLRDINLLINIISAIKNRQRSYELYPSSRPLCAHQSTILGPTY